MAKITGKDVTLSWGSPVVTLAQVESIGGITASSEQIEVTTLDSTSNFREYIQGFKSTSELQITVVWDKSLSSIDAIVDLYDAGTVETFTLTFPFSTTQTIAFSGFVSAYTTPTATLTDALKSTITIRPTGGLSHA